MDEGVSLGPSLIQYAIEVQSMSLLKRNEMGKCLLILDSNKIRDFGPCELINFMNMIPDTGSSYEGI